MKINKKVIILFPIIVAVIVFLSLYYYYNREDGNSLTVSDKRWIEDNLSTIIDLEVVNNYPIMVKMAFFMNLPKILKRIQDLI